MMTRENNPASSRVVDVWRTAGEKLGFTVEAPYEFVLSGRTHSCLAFLPHFGTPKGIIVLGTRPPRFEADRSIAADAAQAGVGCSFVNVELYGRYDQELFESTLSDWGYHGPSDKKPGWLKPWTGG
jgi:hypothetical protein